MTQLQTQTESTYYTSDRISNSKLNVLKRSPEEFYDLFIAKTREQEQTEAMLLGQMVHAMRFEWLEFCKRYEVAPKVDRRTKEGKATYEAFVERNKGKTIVSQDVYDTALSIWQATTENAQVRDILDIKADVEHPFEFTRCGVDCKAKMDFVGRSIIVDLKTTEDASPDAFAKTAGIYGYHRQEAFYRYAFEQVRGHEPSAFFFIVVSKKYPFRCGVYTLDRASVDDAQIQIDSLLEEYKRRKESGDWRSDWTQGVREVTIPKWAI